MQLDLSVTTRGSERPLGQSTFTRRLAWLYPLSAEEIGAAQGLLSGLRTVPTHTELVRESAPTGSVLVLLEGLACRYRTLPNARKQTTGFVLAGDIGDYGFLSARAASQTIMSLGPATVGYIELARLTSATERLPNLMIAFMRGAALEQASSQELVISLGLRDAVQRLAHLLCELHFRLKIVGRVNADQRFSLPMTQAEIGEALGLSTVHVNRTIQQLRRQNLIGMTHGVVTILDVEKLAALADFSSRHLEPDGVRPPVLQ